MRATTRLRQLIAGPDILIEETSSGPETIARVKRGEVVGYTGISGRSMVS